MTLYTRRQLLLLAIVLGGAGIGLGVGHLRRTNPDVVDALEHLDRAPPPVPRMLAPRSSARSRPEAARGTPCEPRRSRRGTTPGEASAVSVEAEPAAVASPGEALGLTTAW